MRVALKPHIDIESESIWRGNIGQGFDESQWDAWFSAYKSFLNHYAELAHEAGVDLLVIGTELRDTSHRESDWRSVIAQARHHYSGPLTYSANHSGEEEDLTWWDGLDYIGISAYYPLAVSGSATVESLEGAWQPHVSKLQALSERWDKQILFTGNWLSQYQRFKY